jgi:dolichyl-phosphate beta-glucosyltransferase
MEVKFDICIVIPCFNEGRYFLFKEYSDFIVAHPGVLFCFVNDGSTDNTQKVLDALKQKYPGQVEVLSSLKNLGKAGAIRKGILHCNDHFVYPYIAYLDADLAVSPDECLSLTGYLTGDIVFCFGSRVLRIGSVIIRKRSRHLVGRVIATIISEMLTLKVYDTQCGCKLFTVELSKKIFVDPFISKWLFDVEIFYRILGIYGKEVSLTKMIEVPLKRWVDGGHSKVKLNYFFKLWSDLYKIRKKYGHVPAKSKCD